MPIGHERRLSADELIDRGFGGFLPACVTERHSLRHPRFALPLPIPLGPHQTISGSRELGSGGDPVIASDEQIPTVVRLVSVKCHDVLLCFRVVDLATGETPVAAGRNAGGQEAAMKARNPVSYWSQYRLTVDSEERALTASHRGAPAVAIVSSPASCAAEKEREST